MSRFYTTSKDGSVLLYKDMDDEGSPCIRVLTETDFGMMALNHVYLDTDEGWKTRGEVFDDTDKVEGMADSLLELVKEMAEDE